MRCDFQPTGKPVKIPGYKHFQCSRRRCRIRAVSPYTPDRIYSECLVRGLGDMIANDLAAYGITKARWNKLRVLLHLKKPCKCRERQVTLNRFGDWLTNLWRAGR